MYLGLVYRSSDISYNSIESSLELSTTLPALCGRCADAARRLAMVIVTCEGFCTIMFQCYLIY